MAAPVATARILNGVQDTPIDSDDVPYYRAKTGVVDIEGFVPNTIVQVPFVAQATRGELVVAGFPPQGVFVGAFVKQASIGTIDVTGLIPQQSLTYWRAIPNANITRPFVTPQYINNVRSLYFVDPLSQATSVDITGVNVAGISYDPATDRIVIATDPGTDTFDDVQMVATLPDAPNAIDVTTLTLTSTLGGTLLPFTVGQPFKQGDVGGTGGLGSSTPYITSTLPNFQADIRNRWSDGSVKFAVLSGRATISAGGSVVIPIQRTSTIPSGTVLTEAGLAGVTASVGTSGFGSATLTFGAPERSILGVHMSEFHYRVPIGFGANLDPHLVAWFYVRLYLGGAIEIETCVENGYLFVAAPAHKTYIPTVTINGTVRYNNGGVALTHLYRSRWMTVNWYDGTSGTTDFARVTVAHDTTYFKATKVVPNFAVGANTTQLNGYPQNITPMGTGNIGPLPLGNPGYQNELGPLQEWDAAYLGSPVVRAYRGVIVNAYNCATWQVGYRDEVTNRPIRLTDRQGLNFNIAQVNGGFVLPVNVASGNTYDYAAGENSHMPAAGYLAYLLTGRWTHLDTLTFWATCSHLFLNPADRGTNWPTLVNDATKGGLATDPGHQDRSKAWHIRQCMLAVSAMPDTCPTTPDQNVRTDWINALNATFPKMITAGDMDCPLGYIGRMTNPGLYGSWVVGRTALYAGGWQMCAIIQCMGWASEIDTFLSTAAHNDMVTLRNWFYKYVVGILGDANGWNYRFYNTYKHVIGTMTPASTGTSTSHTAIWSYSTWGQAFAAAVVETPFNTALVPPDNECVVSVQSAAEGLDILGDAGVFGASKSQTIFPIPAIAYAYDHGAAGSTDAIRRLQTCSDWNQYITTDAQSVPQWAVLPRTPVVTTPTFWSTPFPSTENPISETGKWVNGLTNGTSWNNVQTTGGRAFGTAFSGGPPYNDNIAHIATSYFTATPAQYAQATVYKVPGYTNPEHEIELLLRFSITGGATPTARGYEIIWDVDGNARIVKWLGPLNSYTYTLSPGPVWGPVQIGVPVSGDVLRAEISASNVFTIKKNGVVVGGTTASDTQWTTGQPGMGMWAKAGATLTSYGWEDWIGGNL